MNATHVVDLDHVAAYWKSRKLVDDNRLTFYIRWLSRFLIGPGGNPRLSAGDAHLGHKSVETTMIYTHVIRGFDSTAVSPLDALEKTAD